MSSEEIITRRGEFLCELFGSYNNNLSLHIYNGAYVYDHLINEKPERSSLRIGFVSYTPCLVSAHVDEQKKCVIFRKVSTAETSWWSLGAILYRSLDDIDWSVEAFRDACSVDDDLYRLRLDELIEQGLLKELKNYPQEDYIYGTDQETND